MSSVIEIFCCYAREDKWMLKGLIKHLKPLELQGQIKLWSDTNLNAGDPWEEVLHQHLNSADIILLLISSDFMASDYCYSREMASALQRDKAGDARVIPVLLRSTYWEGAPFAELQILPDGARPVATWYREDDAFLAITKKISTVVGELSTQKTKRQAKILLEKARQLAEKGQYDETLQLYEQTLCLDVYKGAAYLGKAKALYALKRYAEYLKALKLIEQTEPDLLDKQTRQQRDNVLAQQKHEARIQQILAQAHQARKNKKHQQALTLYKEVLRLEPQHGHALLGKAKVLYTLQQYPESLAILALVEKVAPLLDNEAREQKNDMLAYQKYEQTIQQILTQACQLVDQKEHQQALALYEEALQLRPRHGHALLGKAKALYTLQRHPESLAIFERVEQIDPALLDKQAREQKANILTQQKEVLNAFRATLATGDEKAILKEYNATFKTLLSQAESKNLKKVRASLASKLHTNLKKAIDRDDDNAILNIQRDIAAFQIAIPLPQAEKQRIQLAAKRRAAMDKATAEQQRVQQAAKDKTAAEQTAKDKAVVERFQHVFEKGTAHDKVEAFCALPPERIALSTSEQQQLDIARRLLEAFKSNNDELICTVYSAIQSSTLLKHFSFAPTDQQRIQQAQSQLSIMEKLRKILQGDNVNIDQVLSIYRHINSPQNFLSPNEQKTIEAVQEFTRYLHIYSQRRALADAPAEKLIHLYDTLFFSPYHFTFTKNMRKNVQMIERERLNIEWPPIMQLNKRIISSTQFLALYTIKPLHAKAQINIFQQQMATDYSKVRQKYYEDSISFWYHQTTQMHLSITTLRDLMCQVLIEQSISEESEENKHSLEKEVLNLLKDLYKSACAIPAANNFAPVIPLTEEKLQQALLPYSLNTIFAQHLQQTTPEQPLESWLNERLKSAAILYYIYPDEHAPTTQDWQESWLFKWWFIRQHTTAQQAQEAKGV